jgi:hypothetical protein
MYICMCVFIYVCVYVCMYVYICYVFIICMCVCVYIYMYVCTYVCIYMYIYLCMYITTRGPHREFSLNIVQHNFTTTLPVHSQFSLKRTKIRDNLLHTNRRHKRSACTVGYHNQIQQLYNAVVCNITINCKSH